MSPPAKTPLFVTVDKNVFYAWNTRRTVQRPIEGITKIHSYHVDVNRWKKDFRSYLTSSEVPIASGPSRTGRISSNRFSPYPAGDQYVRDKVLDKTRPRYSVRQSRCIQCNESYRKKGECGDKCATDFIAEHAYLETSHIELRHMDMGVGVFVQPNCGGLPAGTQLAVYLGSLIPYVAPEVDDETSKYVFELHNGSEIGSKGGGLAKNQICVDSAVYGNWPRFVNSHCKPNCVGTAATLGKKAYILYETVQDLKEGEELTISYGANYFVSGNMKCQCSAYPEPHTPQEPEPAVQTGDDEPDAEEADQAEGQSMALDEPDVEQDTEMR
ncbi:hypothetical protein QBC39DRAFT_99770 [Podospora conica]|nr:hypothetical protein QBC39DRAFT_99770 [Schizothecium conicum]